MTFKFQPLIPDPLGLPSIFDAPPVDGVGPKPKGDGWFKCGCHCHTAAKNGMKVYHAVACCESGWKQWIRPVQEDDGLPD